MEGLSYPHSPYSSSNTPLPALSGHELSVPDECGDGNSSLDTTPSPRCLLTLSEPGRGAEDSPQSYHASSSCLVAAHSAASSSQCTSSTQLEPSWPPCTKPPMPLVQGGHQETDGQDRHQVAVGRRRYQSRVLMDLPTELLLHILGFLEVYDLLSTSRVSRDTLLCFHSCLFLHLRRAFCFSSMHKFSL